MKTFVKIILIAAFLAGCASSKNPYYNSTMPSLNEKVSLQPIADDLINLLSSHFNPNDTTLYLSTKDWHKSFFKSLEEQLRQKGFAITNETIKDNGNLNAVRIIYVAYNIRQEKSLLLVSFSINESKVNYMYKIQDNKLLPFGSITSFDFNVE